MARCLWVFSIVLTLTLVARPAGACLIYQPFDPSKTLKQYSRQQIAALPEVIVEGVVEPYQPDSLAESKDWYGFTRMQVLRVWKGTVARDIVIFFQVSSTDCSRPPPFGERIRFGARLVEKSLFLTKDAIALTPQRTQLIEAHDDFLLYNTWTAFDLPLQDPELDRLLLAYQAETDALRQRAESGDRAARLAYAAHLFDNNERHRSLAAYESILEDDPADLDALLALAVVRAQVRPDNEPDATLAEVERKAPRTPEWQRKTVHVRFVATGRLTDGWKDWSDLKPAVHCEVSEGNFDDADFTRADLATCEFVRSSFRNASFRGADLTDAYFESSDLTDAKYDCATKLPDDLDMAAAGMMNVEGSCSGN